MPSPLRDPSTLAAVLGSAIADLADIAIVLDLEGRVLTANKTLVARSGLPLEAVIGQSLLDIIHEEDREISRANLDRALRGEVAHYRVVRALSANPQYVSEVTFHPMRDGDDIVAVLCTARDVTKEDVIARERKSAEELLHIAGRMAGFGGWSMDAADRVLRLSDEARAILALPPDREFVLTEMLEAQSEPTRSTVRAAVRECLEEGRSFDLQLDIVTTSGAPITARILGRPERDHTGAVTRALGAIWDVTDVEAERARLVEVEERLTITLDTISDAIMFVDHDWRFTYVNSRALSLTDKAEPELLGHSIWEVFPDGVDGPYWNAYHRALETGDRQQVRAFFEPLAGWFDVTAYPTAAGLALYVRDVTDEELTRQRAEASQRRLADQARLLDASYDAMIVRTLDHSIQYWNKAAHDLYGWSADEALGRSVAELLYDDTAGFENAHASVMRDGYWSGDLEQRTKDGRAIVVEARWQLVFDQQGEPSAIFAVNTDITEARKTAEARLRAQRMESLGTLAGGIAHDLNNVLTPILMSIQLLEQTERRENEKRILSGMEDAVKRGADMIRQVLSFARGVDGRRIRVSVDSLLDDLAVFARDTLPKNIEIEISRAGITGDTMGDPTQLLQVLINLVTNAKDAMPTGGRLRIGASMLSIDDHYTSVSHMASPGDYLTLEVKDNGHGMPAEVVAKVFEPFFTTKELGRGTGLGLATSLAIVRSHGGFMQVSSEVGTGTTFQVALPLASSDETARRQTAEVPDLLPRGRGELILVVDDEPMIAKVTAQTLDSYGYRVVTASNGRNAIDVIESSDRPIDLVLTDMMMPVMDGATLSAHLEEHRPDLPIIAMSGLNSTSSSTRAVGMGIARFLPKPFTTSLLLTVVSDTLRGVAIDENEAI